MNARAVDGNRRSAYRVQPSSVYELDLAILEKRYRVVRVTVADVAIGGAQVQFACDMLNAPLAGERVLLALASESYNFDCTVWARVVASEIAASEHVVSFSFEGDSASLAPGNANFYTLFNRRARYRHLAAAGDPTITASVALTGLDSSLSGSVTVRLDDLSSAGCCVRFVPPIVQSLRKRDQLRLLLTLPGVSGALPVTCRVCHRDEQPAAVRYGCEFEWSADANGQIGAAAIAAYCHERLTPNARLARDRRRNA